MGRDNRSPVAYCSSTTFTNGNFDEKSAVVLVVDDDPGDQELMQWVLEKSKFRYDVHTVANGEEALDYLLRRGQYEDPALSPRPDLILLDLYMPRLDGKQVLEHMRVHPELCGIPVVVISASQYQGDIEHAYRLGCNLFIAKPVDAVQFVNVIRSLEEYWFETVALPPKEG